MIVENIIGKLILLAFIIVCAVLDYRYKKIHIKVFASMLVIEFIVYGIFFLTDMKIEYSSIAGGVLVGAIIYAIAKLTEEKIGLGDACYFTLTGAAMGGLRNICILFGGVMVCAVVGYVMNMKNYVINRKMALLTAALPFGVLAVLAG